MMDSHDSGVTGAYKEVFSQELKKYGMAKFAGMMNNSRCPQAVPPMRLYLSDINVYGITLLSIGAVEVLVVLYFFADTLRYILKNASPKVKAHSAFVIGVYPVVAIATYCALVVPRAHLLAEAMTQGMFMAGMYQLFCLFVAYCGGEAEMIRKVKPEALSLRVGPCCCWPCCLLPVLDITKDRVLYLRMLVLQLPVVQGLIYMILLVMWAERESLYQINYMYFQPVIIVSILIGIWGMFMTMNLLRDVLKDFSMNNKFMVLQMVLLFAKLQGLLTRIAAWSGLLPCKATIPSEVYGNIIHNSLMLGEMVLLGYIARCLYKKILPDNEVPVCVITTIGTVLNDETNKHLTNNNNDKVSTNLNNAEMTITVENTTY